MSGSPSDPFLDVVVCTYDNAGLLDRTLESLASQATPDGLAWGCLVVDNNCTDDTPSVLRRYQESGRIPGFQVVRETVQGLTPARLCGVRNTRAPWIAFVDDDCALSADWIANACVFLAEQPRVGALGGRVVLEWECVPRPWVLEYGYCFAEQRLGPELRSVASLVGAGLVVSREALERCGWTQEPLLQDRVGKKLVSGGDVEIVHRIRSSGYELWYVPSCELRHWIPVRRTQREYLLRMNGGLGASQSYADAMNATSGLGWASTVVRALASRAIELLHLIPNVLRGRRKIAELHMWGAFSLGYLAGALRLLAPGPPPLKRLLATARVPAPYSAAPGVVGGRTGSHPLDRP